MLLSCFCCVCCLVACCRVVLCMVCTQQQDSIICVCIVVDNSVDNFYSGYRVVVDKLLVCCGYVVTTRVRTLYPTKACSQTCVFFMQKCI